MGFIQNMVTERQNIAPRLIIKTVLVTLGKGDFGGNIMFTGYGSCQAESLLAE